MDYTRHETKSRDPDWLLFQSLEPLIRNIGMVLVELSVYRSKNSGNVTVKAIVYKDGTIGIDDCSRAHRLIMTRLDVAFPDRDVFLEVSSPGIDRVIKDGSEFIHYIGRGIRCYRMDISDWTTGTLLSVDEKGIVIREEKGEIALDYEIIAKARLYSVPLHSGGLKNTKKGG